MILNLEQEVKKLAIKRIYSNSTIGMVGHFLVTTLIVILLFTAGVSSTHLLSIIVVHLIILIRRFFISFKFNKVKNELNNYEDIENWIAKYRNVMLYSGLSFGLIPFLVQNLAPEYYFLILSIIVGLAAASIFTVGEILSIYFTYLLSILGSTFVFMMLQDGEAYQIGSLLLFVALYFFGSTARRYSNNFRQVIMDEYTAEEHYLEQRNAQDKIMEQKLSLDYQANYDLLTDLPNRVLFTDRLLHGLQKAQDNSSILAIYSIDLDNFKFVNDSLGHEAGDKVLTLVTSRLKDAIRRFDTLSRFGGDEFTILLEDLPYIEKASRFAEKILKILSEPFFIDGHTFYITSSIGISIYPKDATESGVLMKYAESAMNKAKAEGKNNFQFYSNEMTQLVLDRVILEAALREAIKNEEFVVFYQPQIDARTNRLIGMEALVRWKNSNIGLLEPSKYIPLAEETGMIVEIDKLVMKMAMKQFNKWYEDGYNPGVLSLNLAMKHLEHKKYIEILQETIKESSFNVKYLELELLERDIMKNPEDSIEKLRKISSLGIRIAIDDFGTGYSSLSYLRKLPVNKLKIDKSFVDDILKNEDGKSIVKAVIALTVALNLDMIAEGVEEEAQKDFLIEQGCNYIQGYYYSKPLSAPKMQEFMKSRMS